MNNVFVSSHPLLEHKITLIRDKNTSSKDFKRLVLEISELLCYEVSKTFSLKQIDVLTPIEKTTGSILNQNVILLPVLRAGLGMVEGFSNLLPISKISHLGLKRNEETLQAEVYYINLPSFNKEDQLIILDPMLATGNTLIKAIDILKENGYKNIKYCGIIGTYEGIKNIQKKHPDISIYLAKIDPKLNEKGYIVPGLGDCGDRLFDTK